jgi:hypothetical protein
MLVHYCVLNVVIRERVQKKASITKRGKKNKKKQMDESKLLEAAEELVQCARYGEEEELKGLLETLKPFPQHVNHQNEWGQSALQCAVANGHAAICQALIEAGAEVNRPNKEGNCPLHWAALMGKIDCVKLLVEAQADVNFRNELGRTALDECHARGHSKVFDYLVEQSALPGKEAMEEAQRMNEEAAKDEKEKEEVEEGE